MFVTEWDRIGQPRLGARELTHVDFEAALL